MTRSMEAMNSRRCQSSQVGDRNLHLAQRKMRAQNAITAPSRIRLRDLRARPRWWGSGSVPRLPDPPPPAPARRPRSGIAASAGFSGDRAVHQRCGEIAPKPTVDRHHATAAPAGVGVSDRHRPPRSSPYPAPSGTTLCTFPKSPARIRRRRNRSSRPWCACKMKPPLRRLR